MPNATPSPSSDPEELRKLLWSLRPTLRDLFRSYGVPEEEASLFLRDTIEALARDCERIGRPRPWILEILETRCRRYRESLAEDKEPDGGSSGA